MLPPSRARFARRLGIVLGLLGLALLVFMVTVEDEPGALPLALVAAGAALARWGRPRT